MAPPPYTPPSSALSRNALDLPELYALPLAHGTAVAVALPDPGRPPREPSSEEIARLIAHLPHEEERAYARTVAPRRVVSWIGGRVALHRACERSGALVGPILSTPRGAPKLPAGITGSVSHKRDIAVAIVALEADSHVGIDIEELLATKYEVSRMILTDRELTELAPLDATEKSHATLTRFSIKEAIYKAIDPYVERYVDFKEVEVTPTPDGGGIVSARLTRGEGPFEIDVSWQLRDGYVLTTARASRKG